jgi:NADPH-dependent ferric siderophore reductase
MTTTIDHELPMILTEVTVAAVERLSPSFVRLELADRALADFGVDGCLYDQRIKIVFPNAVGDLPSLTAGPAWYADWLSQPDDRRGHMRTYTVREVRGSGPDTRLVVDFVLHTAPGRTGPGSSWASAARPGDRVLITAPRRGVEYGGIEFDPVGARELLLVADETAVPALCGILRDLGPGARGVAFAEVPEAGDVVPVTAPEGVQLVWLPRDGAAHGILQIDAVRRHLRLPPVVDLVDDRQVDPDLWETPRHSSAGEPLGEDSGPGRTASVGELTGLYAWIAGESRVVTTLRRALVNELGLPRSQVAFMGYWREGVAMRS